MPPPEGITARPVTLEPLPPGYVGGFVLGAAFQVAYWEPLREYLTGQFGRRVEFRLDSRVVDGVGPDPYLSYTVRVAVPGDWAGKIRMGCRALVRGLALGGEAAEERLRQMAEQHRQETMVSANTRYHDVFMDLTREEVEAVVLVVAHSWGNQFSVTADPNESGSTFALTLIARRDTTVRHKDFVTGYLNGVISTYRDAARLAGHITRAAGRAAPHEPDPVGELERPLDLEE